MRFPALLILIALLPQTSLCADKPVEIGDLVGVLEQAEKAGKEMKIPENVHAVPMQQAAEQSKAIYDSPEFRERVKVEMEKLKAATIGEQFDAYYKDAEEKTSPVFLGAEERLYIFVSSSMPIHVVRTYAADVARLKDPKVMLVMRGFVDGMEKIGPTVTYIGDVLKQDPSCNPVDGKKCKMAKANVIIDPLLFRKHVVSKVPSFVYARGVKATNPEMSEGDPANMASSGDAFTMSGDAGLGWILKSMGESAKADVLGKMAAVLR